MVGLYVDSRWTPGRLHMNSMDFEILQVHKHLDSTWSPPQPVPQYNDLMVPAVFIHGSLLNNFIDKYMYSNTYYC